MCIASHRTSVSQTAFWKRCFHCVAEEPETQRLERTCRKSVGSISRHGGNVCRKPWGCPKAIASVSTGLSHTGAIGFYLEIWNQMERQPINLCMWHEEYMAWHQSTASEFSPPGVHNRSSCVSWSKLLNFPVSQFFHMSTGVIMVPHHKEFFFFLTFFYCCSITVVYIFSPPLHSTPAKPTSFPHLHPPPSQGILVIK